MHTCMQTDKALGDGDVVGDGDIYAFGRCGTGRSWCFVLLLCKENWVPRIDCMLTLIFLLPGVEEMGGGWLRPGGGGGGYLSNHET